MRGYIANCCWVSLKNNKINILLCIVLNVGGKDGCGVQLKKSMTRMGFINSRLIGLQMWDFKILCYSSTF